MSEWIPVGRVYLSDESYGELMSDLQDALKEAKFRLNHDPVRQQADLEWRPNDD